MAESRRTEAARILPRIISDIQTLARMPPIDAVIAESHSDGHSDHSDHTDRVKADLLPEINPNPAENAVAPPLEGGDITTSPSEEE